MNIFKTIAKVFKAPIDMLMKAFNKAKEDGLTHDLIVYALPYIREANKKFVDNAERREWCVNVLWAKGVSESLARLVVELAFRLYKKEISDKLGANN